jgi:hypothetical protein
MHTTNPNRPEEEKHIQPKNPKSRRRRRREKQRSKGVEDKQERRRWPKQNHPLLHLETTTRRRKLHGKKDCAKTQRRNLLAQLRTVLSKRIERERERETHKNTQLWRRSRHNSKSVFYFLL